MVSHHLKTGEMSAGSAHVVKIVQSYAGLGDRQRVCRRGAYAARYERLEVCDGGDGKIDVVTPSCGYRVSADPRVAMSLEEGEICLPHFRKTVFFENRISNELIRFTRCIPADLPVWVEGPECTAAFFTDFADESVFFKVFKLIFVF